MQWSRSYLPKEVADQKAMDFVPQKIDLGTPEVALQYMQKKPGSDFRMNEQVQIHTGVDQLEKVNEQEKVEKRALELLTEIQQGAYQEAYQLGLDEGRKSAYDEQAPALSAMMKSFEELLSSIAKMKEEVVAANENHIIKLIYHMASRIAMTHLESNDQAIIDVLKNAVSLAQDEENVRVQISPEQLDFVEELKKQAGREFEFMRKLRLEPNPSVRRGGCVVETNYGEIDARVETRLEKLWESLKDAAPRSKDKITG